MLNCVKLRLDRPRSFDLNVKPVASRQYDKIAIKEYRKLIENFSRSDRSIKVGHGASKNRTIYITDLTKRSKLIY